MNLITFPRVTPSWAQICFARGKLLLPENTFKPLWLLSVYIRLYTITEREMMCTKKCK